MADNDKKIEITKTCPICGKDHSVTVFEKDWKLFNTPNRPHIQRIFPYLLPEDREILMTGIDNDCFQKMFDEGDEDNE